MVVVVILLVSLRSNFVAVSICIGASFGASDSLDIDGLSDSWLIVFAAPSAGVTGADILVTSGEGSVFSFATVDTTVLACFSLESDFASGGTTDGADGAVSAALTWVVLEAASTFTDGF